MARRAMRLALGCAALALLAAPAAQAAPIVWWHWGDEETYEELRPAVEAFERESGRRVEVSAVSWDELRDRLIISLIAGIGPDVSAVSTRWFEELAAQGVFVDLGPFLAQEPPGELDDFFPVSLDLWRTADGTLYALPIDNDIQILFFNADRFEQAGIAPPGESWDWDDWLEAGIRHTVDETGDGHIDRYGMSPWFFTWYSLVWANGGSFFDESGRPAADGPELREALNWWAQWHPPHHGALLLWDELIHLGYDPTQDGTPPEAWRGGRVAMLPAGAWMPTYFVWQESAQNWAFRFGAAPLPRSPAGGRATVLEGQGLAVAATARDPQAAYAFVRWMSGAEAQRIIASFGRYPVRRSVALSDRFFLPPERWPADRQAVVEALSYARPAPKGVHWATAWEEIGELRQFFHGRVGLDEALDALNRRLQARLDSLGR